MNSTNGNDTAVRHDEIARLAKEIWEKEGRQPGKDMENWLRAERQLLSRRNQPSKAERHPAGAMNKAGRFPASTLKPTHG